MAANEKKAPPTAEAAPVENLATGAETLSCYSEEVRKMLIDGGASPGGAYLLSHTLQSLHAIGGLASILTQHVAAISNAREYESKLESLSDTQAFALGFAIEEIAHVCQCDIEGYARNSNRLATDGASLA